MRPQPTAPTDEAHEHGVDVDVAEEHVVDEDLDDDKRQPHRLPRSPASTIKPRRRLDGTAPGVQHATSEESRDDRPAYARRRRRRTPQPDGHAMTRPYSELLRRLAPDHDPAHVEAWLLLRHATLDAIASTQFAGEVAFAVECIDQLDIGHSDELAQALDLQPHYGVGELVLITREGGLPPTAARITAENEHRPHLVNVQYVGRRGAGAWIARIRIAKRLASPPP